MNHLSAQTVPLFDNTEGAHQRLLETVIMFYPPDARVPVRVVSALNHEVPPGMVLPIGLVPLWPAQVKYGCVSSALNPQLQISDFTLGYINKPTSDGAHLVFYLARTPVRRGLQGISTENTIGYTPSGAPVEQWPWTDIQLAKSLAGVFPKLNEAITLLSPGSTGVALSQDVALVLSEDISSFELHIKGKQAGYVTHKLEVKLYPYLRKSAWTDRVLRGCGFTTIL